MAELKPYVFEETHWGVVNYLERISETVEMYPRAIGAVIQAMLLVQAMTEEEYQALLVRAKEEWNRRAGKEEQDG